MKPRLAGVLSHQVPIVCFGPGPGWVNPQQLRNRRGFPDGETDHNTWNVDGTSPPSGSAARRLHRVTNLDREGATALIPIGQKAWENRNGISLARNVGEGWMWANKIVMAR